MPLNLKTQLSAEELENLNSEFLAWSPEEVESRWKDWTGGFALTTPDEEYSARYGYFRLYTKMTWDDLASHDEEFFLDFVIGRQIPMALLLGFDAFNDIIWYFYTRAGDPVKMSDLYSRARDAFESSEAIVGQWKGTPYRLADAVKEMVLIKSRGRDTMEVAGLLDKIRQIMFSKGDALVEKYFTEDTGRAVQNLADLIDFFLDVEPGKIYQLVYFYIHPGYREREIEEISGLKDGSETVGTPPAQREIGVEEFLPTALEEAGQSSVLPPAPKPASVSSAKPAVSMPAPMPTPRPTVVKPSYADIRAKIDSAFKKDGAGNYLDLDGVMDALQKAAEKYNDPRIAEMLYWDEATNKFKWNG